MRIGVQLLAQAFGLSLEGLLSVQESCADGVVQVEAVYAVQ